MVFLMSDESRVHHRRRDPDRRRPDRAVAIAKFLSDAVRPPEDPTSFTTTHTTRESTHAPGQIRTPRQAPGSAVVSDGAVAPLPAGTSMHDLLADPAQRESAATQAGEPLALSEVDFCSPRSCPPRCATSSAFEAHVEGMVPTEGPERHRARRLVRGPDLLLHLDHDAIFGPGDAIEMPPGCEKLDYELEIGTSSARRAATSRWSAPTAHRRLHIYNDFSARDLAAREKRMGLGWAKAKDFANALGPWIVTADEWEPYRRGDRYDMELQASRNGEPLGTDTLASIGWSFAEMVTYASRGALAAHRRRARLGHLRLRLPGRAWGRNGRLEPRPLAPGDEVALSVEGIGTLTNRIVAGVDPLPAPGRAPGRRREYEHPYLKAPNPPTTEATDELRARVSEMLRDIEQGGLDAVRRYSSELDGWAPDDFVVSDAEFERVGGRARRRRSRSTSPSPRTRSAASPRRSGHARGRWRSRSGPGVVLGHRHIPVNAVGAYVPGGRYPMLASSFMTVLVAKVAGVRQVVGCAPPQRERGIHPAMLYAMQTSGADAVLCLGGVQALAAMAFGLIDGLEPVDMLVGAGNAFVAEAKRQLFGRVGIDLLAGPTEVLVIADESADPRLVATDLLGQAEHGPNSPAGCIADRRGRRPRGVRRRSRSCCRRGRRPRSPARRGATTAGSRSPRTTRRRWRSPTTPPTSTSRCRSSEDKLDWYLERLTNYGSLFLGDQATVAYGDKAVGTNHVLPTSRAARYTGGPVGGQVPQDLHLPAADRRRARGASRPAVAAICARRALRGSRADGRGAARARRADCQRERPAGR